MGACFSGCMRLVSRNQASYESIADTRDEPQKQEEKYANGTSSQKQKQPVIVNEIVPITPGPGVPIYQGVGGASQGSRSGFFLKYEMKEEIGVGSTSKCFRCVRKSDGKTFACKVIDKRQVEIKFSGLLDQFFIEIKVRFC
jgi:hypothetical protein